MSRFPPVHQDEADNSKPKWSSRRSVKSTLPKSQDQNIVVPKTVETKTVESKTVESKTAESKTVEPKIVGSKPAESKMVEPQKIRLQQNDINESEDKENRNHKPATIEELSSAIR